MPTIVLRIDEDADIPEGEPPSYVAWSTITEAPVAWGDVAYVASRLASAYPGTDSDNIERFDRADRTGTSDLSIKLGEWGDTLIYQQQGTVGRPQLRTMLERLTEDQNADVSDLLTPLDDLEAVLEGREAP